ncbi:unnamed protein product [Lactuca saligna]|uniref:Uncharacterized protein n=1 Tax=Lactuca saligna TaxID=75948 RepID=A0AA35ZN67_LACSI|nr:unnamed protein product [Lactuca saligna]
MTMRHLSRGEQLSPPLPLSPQTDSINDRLLPASLSSRLHFSTVTIDSSAIVGRRLCVLSPSPYEPPPQSSASSLSDESSLFPSHRSPKNLLPTLMVFPFPLLFEHTIASTLTLNPESSHQFSCRPPPSSPTSNIAY